MIDVQYIAETQTTPKKIDLLDDIISFHSGYKNKQKKKTELLENNKRWLPNYYCLDF